MTKVLGLQDVERIVHRCVDTMIGQKDALTAIDSITGDGDLGVSMEKAALAVRAKLEGLRPQTIEQLLSQCAAAINKAAPSTMGTLISMAALALSNAWKGKMELTETDVVAAPRILANAIMKIGRSAPGDKTILDALLPFAQALETRYRQTGDFNAALQDAKKAARTGMEATAGMSAKVGRARWLGDRAAKAVDGGAALFVMIVEAL